MARLSIRIDSALSAADAFAYLAEFTNAPQWNPRVRAANRVDGGPLGVGSVFELSERFVGRELSLRYGILSYEPPARIVLEANAAAVCARDTIAVWPSPYGSAVSYEAELAFAGRRGVLLDPLVQLLLERTNARVTNGLRQALDPLWARS